MKSLLILLCPLLGYAAQEAPGNLPARPIAANDLISVTVYGSPELTRSLRVASDGSIRFPMLPEKISVAGLQPVQLEERIAQELEAANLLVEPAVTVAIAEYAARQVSVAGAVRKPLTFEITQKTTLLEAITRAEGVSPEAGGDILVTRPVTADGKPGLVERVPLRDLVEQSDPKYNLILEGGEEIRVPEMGRVFVVGNVKKPGAFRLEDKNGLSVLKALALAEGLTPFSTREAYIYRKTDGGQGVAPQEKTIPLRKILDRQSPDVQLEANDILYIPDNRRGHTTAAVVERVVAFAAGTASGALVLSVNH